MDDPVLGPFFMFIGVCAAFSLPILLLFIAGWPRQVAEALTPPAADAAHKPQRPASSKQIEGHAVKGGRVVFNGTYWIFYEDSSGPGRIMSEPEVQRRMRKH